MKPCIKLIETAAYVKIEKIALKGIEPGGCVIITPVEFLWQISRLGEIEDSQKCKKTEETKTFQK